MKQVLLYNLIGCIHLEKDINQWVFPLWRQKGLFHRREGINRLVQGTLCELSYTVYLRGKKKKVIFFCFVGFGSVKQNSQCSPRKAKEFCSILKTHLKTPLPLCRAVNVARCCFGCRSPCGCSPKRCAARVQPRCWGIGHQLLSNQRPLTIRGKRLQMF